MYEYRKSALCFEPTYKELKLVKGKDMGLSVLGFEPTYKELKLGQVREFSSGLTPVLSLPIRNWNPFLKTGLTLLEPVLSLPIRNWNKRGGGVMKQVVVFWAYL